MILKQFPRLAWRSLIVSGIILVGASSLATASPMKIPLSFDSYIECLGPRSMVTRQDWWVVYVDRDNVPVYVDRHGTEVNSNLELSLGEELWVLEEEQSSRMLLLGESHSNPRDKEDPEITNTVGWVEWDHLILSREPMKNRETLVSKKAFVVNDWRRFKKADDIQDFRDAKVSVRAAPSTDAIELGKITGIGDRLSYIYKQESCDVNAQWYLVGRRNSIIPGSVDENIIGWIPASRAQPWDTRQALEPKRNRKGPAHVYTLEADLTDPTVEPMFKDKMNSGKPWPADKWRYVILDAEQGREGILIGWQGSLAVASETGETTLQPGTEIARAAAMTYASMKNVNIIFVFDATTSMGPYLKAVATSLESVMSRVKAKPYHRDMKVRFGAVVYRDLKDIPKEKISLQKLTPDHNTVVRFLKNQKKPSTAQDSDYPEAVFKGVETALSELAVVDQTNILIVIGDAGNNDSDHRLSKDFEADVALLAPRILAVHLRRPGASPEETAAIAKFRPDLERVFAVVEGDQETRREDMRPIWSETGGVGPMPETPSTKLVQTGADREDILGTQETVETALREMLSLNREMMKLLPDFLGGAHGEGESSPRSVSSDNGGISDYEISANVIAVLARFAADGDAFRTLLNDKVQIFEKGWVRLRDDEGNNTMTPVQLVSLTELDQTERALLKLFPSGRDADPTDLLQSWRDIVGVILGDEPANVREYVDMVGGILFRENSPILALNFDEILDMSDEEFQAVLKYAKEALDRVGELRTNQEIWFENYSDRYAWIPTEQLP